MLRACPRCGAGFGLEHQQPDGVTQCPGCQHLFHPSGDGYPWPWVIAGLLFALGMVKNFTDPIVPIDTRESWHLRQERRENR